MTHIIVLCIFFSCISSTTSLRISRAVSEILDVQDQTVKIGKDPESAVTHIVVEENGTESVFSKQIPAQHCDKPIWWLHIPKTGTSFHASTAQCPQHSGRSNAQHQNLPKNATQELLSSVASMFRHPQERLLSAYYYIQKVFPHCCVEDWGWQSDVFIPVKEQIAQGRAPAEILHNFVGCQTNMITGSAGCMSGHHPTRAEITEAIRRVEQFGFVGLTSEWELSVCLFNYYTTGTRFIRSFQLTNVRPTHGKSQTAYNRSEAPVDTFDVSLYNFAESRFWNDVKKNGITHENCKLVSDE